jgi:DNA primase
MQVYVPLNISVTYQETEPFAKTLAQFLEQEHPRHVVLQYDEGVANQQGAD